MNKKIITLEDIKAITETKSDELRKKKLKKFIDDFVNKDMQFDTKKAYSLFFKLYIEGDIEHISGLFDKVKSELHRLFPVNKKDMIDVEKLKKLHMLSGMQKIAQKNQTKPEKLEDSSSVIIKGRQQITRS